MLEHTPQLNVRLGTIVRPVLSLPHRYHVLLVNSEQRKEQVPYQTVLIVKQESIVNRVPMLEPCVHKDFIALLPLLLLQSAQLASSVMQLVSLLQPNVLLA